MNLHPNIKFASPKLPAPKGSLVINVTSVSTDWAQRLSPMLPEPEQLELNGLRSWTVENFWQFSKRYDEHLTDDSAWDRWRQAGFAKRSGIRYPMGKLRKPHFAGLSFTDRFGPVEARQKIYIPAFMQKLERFCQEELAKIRQYLSEGLVYIWDYDVYDPEGKSFEELVQAKPSLGHGFLVAKAVSE